MTVAAGMTMTCSNDECDCRLEVVQPCPHGDAFTCGCGHPLRPEEREPLPPTPGA